jgi:hypothetical protein
LHGLLAMILFCLYQYWVKQIPIATLVGVVMAAPEAGGRGGEPIGA